MFWLAYIDLTSPWGSLLPHFYFASKHHLGSEQNTDSYARDADHTHTPTQASLKNKFLSNLWQFIIQCQF